MSLQGRQRRFQSLSRREAKAAEREFSRRVKMAAKRMAAFETQDKVAEVRGLGFESLNVGQLLAVARSIGVQPGWFFRRAAKS